MITVYVNGKFLAQRLTGVQRAAREWLRAVDSVLASDQEGGGCWVVLHPPEVAPPLLQAIETRGVGWRGMPLHLWEQWSLPRASRDGVVLSLAGSSPWCARRQAATLHDAAVWDQPQAYSWAFRTWYRWLFRHLGRRALKVFTVSEFSRARLGACLHQPVQRFSVLANGADHLDRVDADDQLMFKRGLAGRRYFLAVASANPSKNLKRLVQAYERSGLSSQAQLVLVGSGNDKVFADAALPTAEGVLYLGAIDDPSLKALYYGALALLQPSLYEGFGLPPLEAMSCGCPVAASRTAALPEVCGNAAIYFDPLSIEDMADSMGLLMRDALLRERLSRAGRVRAATFNWAASATRLRDEMRDIS
jgi:glycosyltransferase involved in cell wall biosynthesis